MNRTPLLRPLRDNGDTLYVFPSASEDIGLNLNSRATGVAMSHYALLNLPNLCGKTNAYDESIAIATELQNYVMNFETLLLNQKQYNYLEYHTVSERVFWHWLHRRLKKLNVKNNINNKSSDLFYTEDFNVNKLVLCFGSIDAGNSLSTEFGMFNETYVNIPTSYGNGPVFFKQVQDSSEMNYIYGKIYNSTNKLQGRESHIDTLKILESETPLHDNSTQYIADDCFEIVKDIPEILQALRDFTGKTIDIISYDDVNVDNTEQFKDTVFDITTNKVEFGFNAILLYYSVYDLNDPTKSAYATNLFGIVFLGSPKKVGENESCVIECINKKKSYKGSNSPSFFGNSYSFRVNIKTMSVYDNTDAVILDNTTMSSISSVDFSEVVSNLNRAIDVMNTNVLSTMAIQDQYMQILRYYDEQTDKIDDISTKINGFINGNKSSAVTTDNLRTNRILPKETSTNSVKITLTKQLTDYIDNDLYIGTTYIPSIHIANNDIANVPVVYKPVVNIETKEETAIGEWNDTIGLTNDIIDGIGIKYYTYNEQVYPSIKLPYETIDGYGLNGYMYKTGEQLKDLDEFKLVNYVNYDALIPLMITYIQNLKSEIETLKSEIEELKS